MYGYNAGPPMAIPIYTVLPYCVMEYPMACTNIAQIYNEVKACFLLSTTYQTWGIYTLHSCQK